MKRYVNEIIQEIKMSLNLSNDELEKLLKLDHIKDLLLLENVFEDMYHKDVEKLIKAYNFIKSQDDLNSKKLIKEFIEKT